MTTDVTFTDAEFSFTQDGVVFRVHTEVGNGPARVVVQEIGEQDKQPMEAGNE